eukprot:821806-Rhodomonas_salina.1
MRGVCAYEGRMWRREPLLLAPDLLPHTLLLSHLPQYVPQYRTSVPDLSRYVPQYCTFHSAKRSGTRDASTVASPNALRYTRMSVGSPTRRGVGSIST